MRASATDLRTSLHDEDDALERAEILERVAVERDQVGVLARLERAGARLDAEGLGTARGAARSVRAGRRRSGRQSAPRRPCARACCRCRARAADPRPGCAPSARRRARGPARGSRRMRGCRRRRARSRPGGRGSRTCRRASTRRRASPDLVVRRDRSVLDRADARPGGGGQARPPCAWAATYVPARSASSTAARISS